MLCRTAQATPVGLERDFQTSIAKENGNGDHPDSPTWQGYGDRGRAVHELGARRQVVEVDDQRRPSRSEPVQRRGWRHRCGAYCVAKARARCGVSAEARVHSCYEADRDGWWLHRWLLEHGIDNIVVDSASIEVNRRARRAKTDRLEWRQAAGDAAAPPRRRACL